jgi:hypothetical protein
MKSEIWRRFLRLFLFLFELLMLLEFLSITYLVPFPYDFWRLSMVIVAALISLAVACWVQVLRLRNSDEAVSFGSIALSAPVILWVCVAVICVPTAVYGFWMTSRHQWP